MEIVLETRLNSLKRGSSDEVLSIHSCAFYEYTYKERQNQEDQIPFEGKSTFSVIIYHSRLSKPLSFVIQWNADMHFFCLNPHLTGSPAGRCYWQLSLRKYTGWYPDPFEDSGSLSMAFSRAVIYALPFDKGSKLLTITVI